MKKLNQSTILYLSTKAFTLAEILLVLGTIGIVAALTLPTLITNYQKQQTVTRLQKMYSSLNSAVKMSVIENGSVQTWDYPTIDWDTTQSQAWWNTYFVPYSNLSVIKQCTSSNITECWASDSKFLDGAPAAASIGGYFDWILQDGSCLSFASISSVDAQIFVDLNGLKKPNIVGKDIFYFTINKTKGSAVLGGLNSSRSYLLDDHQASCNKSTGTYKGAYCGAIIQLDGWKISDDYPWN